LVVDRAGVRRGHLLSRSPAVEDLHLVTGPEGTRRSWSPWRA
jgi:hypothetical protein